MHIYFNTSLAQRVTANQPICGVETSDSFFCTYYPFRTIDAAIAPINAIAATTTNILWPQAVESADVGASFLGQSPITNNRKDNTPVLHQCVGCGFYAYGVRRATVQLWLGEGINY